MTRSKVPSDADLQVGLLKRIAEYKRKRILVTDLLPHFIKDVLGSDEWQPALSLLTPDRA
jgi:glucan phosphorylase